MCCLIELLHWIPKPLKSQKRFCSSYYFQNIHRVRNREHAKRSRLRKKSLTQTLQQSVDSLKAENRKMREMLQSRIGKQKADDIIHEQRSRSFLQFMESLQRPTGRVLDDQSLLYMKSLKRKIPKQSKKSKGSSTVPKAV